MADQGSNSAARLSIGDKTIDLPILSGSVGPQVIDVGRLTAEGYFTYDPGFVSTASCESAITYIDGGKGILLHRGYPIDQLAEHSDYLELCYLLLNGELAELNIANAYLAPDGMRVDIALKGKLKVGMKSSLP